MPSLDFDSLHASHRAAVLRYLRRQVGEADAEDVTQLVFERAHKALPEFRGESSVASWLFRIAGNAALDLLRSPAFSRKGPSLDDLDEPRSSVHADSPPDNERQAIRNEMNACIREVVDSLPANYRVILILADLEGFTTGEIADRLGLTLDTAKIRLHRARAKLRKALERECRFYRNDLGQLSCDRKQAYER